MDKENVVCVYTMEYLFSLEKEGNPITNDSISEP